jgi:hypothetical protein
VRWWVLALLAACYSPRAIDAHCARCQDITTCPNGEPCVDGFCQQTPGQCANEHDSGIDSPKVIDAPPGCFGVDAPPFRTMCIPVEVVVPETVTLTTVITTGGVVNSCTYVDKSDPARELCVIAADNIDVMTDYKAVGSRPLVLLARKTLTIAQSGILELAGHASDAPASPITPAGANETSCTGDAGGPANGPLGAGGGAGGSFATRGGAGGANGSGIATTGDAPIMNPPLRGGCRGGDGGNNTTSGGGFGGNSGGAIYLLATMMTIDGQINASGGGGRGVAIPGAGGGGGGSGGMILMWSAAPIALGTSARVFAIGGGGGLGGSTQSGQIGDDPGGPTDPATATPTTLGPSAGGGGTVDADGNPGVQGTTTSGPNGGGGGGGGVGFIRAMPPMQPSEKIAPPPG